jgi:hypothetical protein
MSPALACLRTFVLSASAAEASFPANFRFWLVVDAENFLRD